MCFCVYFIKLIVKFKILDQKGYQQNSKLEKKPHSFIETPGTHK